MVQGFGLPVWSKAESLRNLHTSARSRQQSLPANNCCQMARLYCLITPLMSSLASQRLESKATAFIFAQLIQLDWDYFAIEFTDINNRLRVIERSKHIYTYSVLKMNVKLWRGVSANSDYSRTGETIREESFPVAIILLLWIGLCIWETLSSSVRLGDVVWSPYAGPSLTRSVARPSMCPQQVCLPSCLYVINYKF